MQDLYERHARAVEVWRAACERVEEARQECARVRQILDDAGQELLASCADSKRIKPIVKRGRKANAKLVAEGVLVADRLTKIKPNGAEIGQ